MIFFYARRLAPPRRATSAEWIVPSAVAATRLGRGRAIAWQAYAQGEYVGHARLRTSRVSAPSRRSTRLDLPLDAGRDLHALQAECGRRGSRRIVQRFRDQPRLDHPTDGTITLRLLGQVHATGRTVSQLRDALEKLYTEYYKIPAITVTPLKVNTKLEDLRATIDRRAGIGGQSQAVRVTPEGTIALPAIGTVQAQGLTLPELQTELNECYRQIVEGIQVIPMLVQRAPRYVYVLGEVNNPGRFELTGRPPLFRPEHGWKLARRGEFAADHRVPPGRRLAAAGHDDRPPGALLGNQPCPKGEIWIDDST